MWSPSLRCNPTSPWTPEIEPPTIRSPSWNLTLGEGGTCPTWRQTLILGGSGAVCTGMRTSMWPLHMNVTRSAMISMFLNLYRTWRALRHNTQCKQKSFCCRSVFKSKVILDDWKSHKQESHLDCTNITNTINHWHMMVQTWLKSRPGRGRDEVQKWWGCCTNMIGCGTNMIGTLYKHAICMRATRFWPQVLNCRKAHIVNTSKLQPAHL